MAGFLSRIFGGGAGAGKATPHAPDGMRIYAIGDIHGRLDLLKVLVERINADFSASGARQQVIICVGDYVDRGLNSRGVIDFLIDGMPKAAECRFLMGNHEEAFLQFMDDPAIGPRWKDFGGLETLHSYGVEIASNALKDARWFAEAREELNRNIPPRHLAFLRNLEMTAEYGDYYFVHAGIRPGVKLNRQIGVDQLWIRDEFLSDRRDHGKIIVHGHTPVMEVDLQPNRIGIDTGAYLTNNLSALVLDGAFRGLLDTKSHNRPLDLGMAA
ncbi:MAG TPA: metallophosphoesterase family protein [Micropepsaceae bacterium]|nr:metallophosphoesterase family protein [Micropepsaceae bacterium]